METTQIGMELIAVEKRIRLERMQTEESFGSFARLVFNSEVMNMNLGRVFSQEEARIYFSNILAYNNTQEGSGTYNVFLEESNRNIGMVSLWVNGEIGEVEYMVLPEYWNQGYATEAVKLLVDMAKQNSSVRKVCGLIDPDNAASKRVLLKNGFVFEEVHYVEENASNVEVYCVYV